MQKSAVYLCLLTTLGALAAPVIPSSAQKYLDVLQKRPQPDAVFERFYTAWLEEGTAAGLLEYLSAQASGARAAATDHLILALFHSHRGYDREALAAYDAALKLDAKNAGAWLERARIEARLLDFPVALTSVEQAAAAQPSDSLALDIARFKGRLLLRLDRNDEALALWRDIVQKNAGNEDLIEEVIDWFAEEAQYEAAIETSQALVKRTRDPLARTLRQLRLADVLLQAERRDESLAMLDTVFAATGAETWIEADVLGRIERVFRMTDDVAGLERHLAELTSAHPQRVTLAWQHAQLLAGTGHSAEALSSAKALLHANPGRRDLQDQFLDLLDSLNQPREAVAQAQALSRQNPADKELLIRLALLQQRAGDIAAASATLEAYITAAGADEAALLRAARLQEGWEKSPDKDESAAFKAYQRLGATFPESGSAQEACAHYLHRSNRREQALAIWKRLAKNAGLEDLLRIAQALQARLESRTALDILLAREADFPRQPRFLALLVQTATANEEFERALPWALERLRLMHDVDGIEDAMVPLRILLRPEHAKQAAPLMEELRKKASPSIQDRCLLAMFLHENGDAAAAEKMLKDAPDADRLIALVQLSKLQQAGKEWAAAAQTLQQIVSLPNARTAARLQFLVDMLRRASQPAQALQQIPAWKMLTPSAIEPWLVEARVLGELYRTADALKVLRQAVRKFPDAAETAHAYATACLEGGDAAEAERIYLSLYEKTTDTEARLRLLPPLVLAAQQHNALAHLVENFQRRQQQNRASAFPWLALAEIHRAAQNQEERLRCLYEASRLRPQDLGLLLEIARNEETEGLYPEAVRTLEAAAKLDKTTKVRERLAKLQIENGDADAGYRILFDLAGGGQMGAATIEQIADAMALRGDWKNIPKLLQPLLEQHPRHYRLHYLCGVAQEESGQENEALATFLRVMDMHEEIAGTPPATPPGDIRSLPAGTEDWMRFASCAASAYAYQQRSRDLRYTWSQSVAAPPFLISLPPDVLQSPAFALAHVLKIASTRPEDEQQRVMTQLRRAGIAEASLLLEAQLGPEGFAITPALLAAHPADAALHAAWLLSPTETFDAPALDRCFELFKDAHPDLAILAADQVQQKGPVENGEVWVRRLIRLCSPLPRSTQREWEALARLLWSQFPELKNPPEDPVIYLNAAETEEIVAILHRWIRQDTRLLSVREMTTVLLAHERWDAAVDGFQRMIELATEPASLPPPAGLACTPRRYWNAAPLTLIAADTGMPPSIIEALGPMLGSLSAESPNVDENNMLRPLFLKNTVGEERQMVPKFQAAVRRRIAGVEDARLRLFLRLLSGDARALLAEQEPRAQSAKATLHDLLFTGWLHQFLEEDEKALRMFQSAAKLTQDSQLLQHLDSACLYLAMFKGGDAEVAADAIRQVLDRILKHAPTADEKREILPFLQEYGLKDEAERLLNSLTTPYTAQNRNTAANNQASVQNPYSSMLATGRRGSAQDLLDHLLLQDNHTGALAEASRRTRRLAAAWLGNRAGGGDDQQDLITLLMKLGMHELREPFLSQLKADAGTDWEKRQEYAAVLDMQHAHGRVFQNNDGPRSLTLEELRFHTIQEYEAVLVANPQAPGVHRRLFMLQASEDDAAALRHLKALPETAQSTLLFDLTDRAYRAQDPAQITAATRFVTSWLKSRDAARPFPYQARDDLGFILGKVDGGNGWPSLQEAFGPGSAAGWEFDSNGVLKIDETLRRQRNDRRIAYEALCRTMTRIPDLAEMGFGPLSGLAIFEQRDLPGMEQLALQVLSLRASQPSARRQTAPRPPPADSSRLFEDDHSIANQPAAFFATWNAARRRDVDALENTIYPAILKADGQPMLDFCRGYAGIVLASDENFTTAATEWVKRWLPVSNASPEAFNSGGMVSEVVRLWEARGITAPLDDLFLPYKALSISPRDAMVHSRLILAPTPYVRALLKREPGELRRFLLRIRDDWISPAADVRRHAMARHLSNEIRHTAYRDTPVERAAGSCLEWLNYLMQSEGSQAAFEAAAEDGALDPKEWVQNFTVEADSVQTPGEFMLLLRQLGYLQGGTGPRLLATPWDQPGQALWHSRSWLARSFNDSSATAVVDLLGRHQPGGFDCHLLQAMFVREDVKSIHLDGRRVMLNAPPGSGPMTRREVAYRLVILRHAAEIAAMPVQERKTLGALLEAEQPRLLRNAPADAELMRALEPVIRASKPAAEKTATPQASRLETNKP